MPYFKTSVLVGLFGLSLACIAHSTSVFCPSKITTTQQLTGEYGEWKSFVDDAVHGMDGVSFYSGDPHEQAVLKPDSMTKDKATWRFASRDTIYIVCQYNQTIIRLSKVLPAYTTQCVVSYNLSINGVNGPVPSNIACQ